MTRKKPCRNIVESIISQIDIYQLYGNILGLDGGVCLEWHLLARDYHFTIAQVRPTKWLHTMTLDVKYTS